MYFVLKFLILFLNVSIREAFDNYGPYKIQWIDFKTCNNDANSARGSTLSVRMIEHKPDPMFQFNFTFLTSKRLDELKLSAYLLKDNRKNVVQNTKLDKPCKHYIVKKLLQVFMNVSSNCVVPKGHYLFEVNFNEMANIFIGSKFFYGEYFAKPLLISNKKYVGCLIVHSNFTKADSDEKKV